MYKPPNLEQPEWAKPRETLEPRCLMLTIGWKMQTRRVESSHGEDQPGEMRGRAVYDVMQGSL